MFLAWVIYCLPLGNVYQVFLTTFLVELGLQHRIPTEEEILASKLELGMDKSKGKVPVLN
jgi:hypothetical protein